MKDSKNCNKPKNYCHNLPSPKTNSWPCKTPWPASDELSAKCSKNYQNKPPKTTSWPFTRVKPPSSPKRNNKPKINLKLKNNMPQDSKPKSVKSNNKSTRSKVLDSKRTSFKTISASSRKRKPSTQSANRKYKKLSGKPAISSEQNSC